MGSVQKSFRSVAFDGFIGQAYAKANEISVVIEGDYEEYVGFNESRFVDKNGTQCIFIHSLS